MLFVVQAPEIPALDRAEGLRKGYHKSTPEVLAETGATPCFLCLADENAIDDSLKPYDWYKQVIVIGAKEHGLRMSGRLLKCEF